LTTVAAPDPAGPSVNIQNVANNLVVSWPPEFGSYLVQSNANLSTTNWITLGTNSFLVFPVDNNVSQGYFRLLKP
jgi:hypothetical protein